MISPIILNFCRKQRSAGKGTEVGPRVPRRSGEWFSWPAGIEGRLVKVRGQRDETGELAVRRRQVRIGPWTAALDDKNMRTFVTLVSMLHLVLAVLAFSAWAMGMYYWHVTNNSLKPGVSKFALLHPTAYWNAELFTERGIESRQRTITAFALMGALALLAFGVRWLKEA